MYSNDLDNDDFVHRMIMDEKIDFFLSDNDESARTIRHNNYHYTSTVSRSKFGDKSAFNWHKKALLTMILILIIVITITFIF